MRTETIVAYFADDGTPFKQNKDACEIYDKLCAKTKNWLRRGTVMFWDGSETYMNFELIDYTFADNLCYLDWLKKRLQYCHFIIVNSQPGEEAWEDLWEFVSKYCPISESESIKLKRDYKEGDLLAYDVPDCKFHNFSLVARNTDIIHNRLKLNLANHAMANRDKWEEISNG